MTKTISFNNFIVKIYKTREEMGFSASNDIAQAIRDILAQKEECNIIFAAAPSQREMLAALIKEPNISWNQVNAFHMDEYLELGDNAPQKFSTFLRSAIFDKVSFKSVNYINSVPEIEAASECGRYSELLKTYPVDITCMGIGENGHIAFNDPPVANFNDPALIKLVALDDICRNQQVNDNCFAKLSDVPKTALTVTIPALMRSSKIFCVVPSATKADAVRKTLLGEISTECPASILRNHSSATLYLDLDSASLI